MAFFQRAAQVWRDFVTDGVPSSDKHEPKKSEIRGWARDIENALDALAVTGSFQGRWDASSGSFPSGAQKGYSWIVGAPGTVNGRFFSEGDRIIALVNGASSAAYLNNWVTVPAGASGVTPAVDLGEGTANAIQVKTEAGGGVREGSLLAFTLYRDTTSAPVTLTVDGGGPMTVKSNVGANASALVAGQFILGQVRSGELVFVNDQDVASLVAQAEAARDEAVDLVAGINLPSVSSSDSGKTLFVKPDGSGYDAGRIDTAGRVTFNRIIDAPLLVQKKLMEPFTGFDNGIGTNTEIFAGAGFTAQGLTVVTTSDGTRYLFIVIRCVADNYKITERCRIVQYPLKDDGSLGAHVAFSEELNIGHAGGLSHTIDNSDNITFYSWMPTMVGHEDNDAGKGFSKIEWAGSTTSQSDVTGYQVFGWNGSHTSRSKYRHMDCSVDPVSREIAFIGYKRVLSGDDFINQTVFVFDLDTLIGAADDNARLSVVPKHQWVHPTASFDRSMYKQGIAIRNGVIATISGFTNPLFPEAISLFDIRGNLIRRVFPTSIRSEYGREGLLNHPALGNPIQFEPEGICWLDDGELAFQMMDQWRASPSIVNYSSPGGVTKRFARIASSGVAAPTQVDQWVETTKAATSGDWSASGTYSLGDLRP